MEVRTLLNSFVINEAEISHSKSTDVEPLFVWGDQYCIGVTEVDRQHQILVHLINDLNQGIAEKHSMDSIQKALDSLVQYTISHFAFEEELFAHSEYPDVEAHKQSHKKLVGQVIGFVDRVKAGDHSEQLFNELLTFLKEWLIHHIQGTDKKYVHHFKQHGLM
ncbi:MAG: bacteriohemerythrin [Gammaproteobacteria bacterium]|nr:bacteriohemerythrin [Gammaproteobacteria bacterium]